MKDTLLLDDAEFPQAFVFCDNCNPEWDPHSPDGSTFTGPEGEAFKAGWTLREFGHMCPTCAVQEARLDQEIDSGALMPAEVVDLVSKADTE